MLFQTVEYEMDVLRRQNEVPLSHLDGVDLKVAKALEGLLKRARSIARYYGDVPVDHCAGFRATQGHT